MIDEAQRGLAQRVGQALLARRLMLATAESCTGGLIAGAITDIAGSSGWFDRGFVTYSDDAKVEMLGVRTETLNAHGAVSEATAAAMAQAPSPTATQRSPWPLPALPDRAEA
jgi:nicotinamide-nucleotide amidase